MGFEFQTTLTLGLLNLSKQPWVIGPAIAVGLLAPRLGRLLLLWLVAVAGLLAFGQWAYGLNWFGNGNEGFAAALALVVLAVALAAHIPRRIVTRLFAR